MVVLQRVLAPRVCWSAARITSHRTAPSAQGLLACPIGGFSCAGTSTTSAPPQLKKHCIYRALRHELSNARPTFARLLLSRPPARFPKRWPSFGGCAVLGAGGSLRIHTLLSAIVAPPNAQRDRRDERQTVLRCRRSGCSRQCSPHEWSKRLEPVPPWPAGRLTTRT